MPHLLSDPIHQRQLRLFRVPRDTSGRIPGALHALGGRLHAAAGRDDLWSLQAIRPERETGGA